MCLTSTRKMSETTCNWGANGGKCTDCFVCEPCCGQPCNVAQGCYCFWCLYCCGYCVLAKLWAYSQDKPCGFLNHFFIMFVFSLFTKYANFHFLLHTI